MDKERLFEILDIESGADFQYFENISELLECDEDIDSDLIYELMTDVDLEIFASICESYFEDIMEAIPGNDIDLYTLLDNIKRALIGMAKSPQDDKTLIHLSDQLCSFKEWYCDDDNVSCQNSETGDTNFVNIRDALLLSRLEKLNGEAYTYDFTKALEYQIEEYIMTFADLID